MYVFCKNCGGDKKIADDSTQWQCQYCGATHKIEKIVEKKVVEKKKEKKIKIESIMENEDVREQDSAEETPSYKPKWGNKEEE